MKNNLTTDELKSLVESVFSPSKDDKRLALLIDVPENKVKDNSSWRKRRVLAKDWQQRLDEVKFDLGLEEANLILYPNVFSNNADLPQNCYFYRDDIEEVTVSLLEKSGRLQPFNNALTSHQLLIALTELSATAPLKLNAKKFGFRAVTMPGFSEEMLPSLRLDYQKINERIMVIKNILDPATGLEIEFELPDKSMHKVYFDLRYRTAHASGGRFPDVGTAGNLPGGECYIVPYEGEKGEPTRSSGTLPVQFKKEIVIYKIEQNVATKVTSDGTFLKIEANKLKSEPAYGNIAEIGFGILKYFGLKPINQILLDEKLGLHIAFGRSDHFGGAVGIKDFNKPDNVIHIDRLYIPETQDKIRVNYVKVENENGEKREIMTDGEYMIF